MQWEGSGILLAATAFGESSAVARVLVRGQGVSAGLVKGGFSKKNKGMMQPGNRVFARWSGRLEGQLGSFTLEAEEPVAAMAMGSAEALLALQLTCRLLLQNLPEHHPYPHLYDATVEWLSVLAAAPSKVGEWLPVYALWEMTLLQEMGFALDLTECAATGGREELVYISPKSGRAVSRAAGEPYAEKLLPFPAMYREDAGAPTVPQCLDALAVSGYFLEQWLLAPHGRGMPPLREQWLTRLARQADA